MKHLISYALALALVIAIPDMAMAKGKRGENGYGGKVTAVDTTANTITVTKHRTGETKTFKTAGATITVEGAVAKLSDVTVGMHVRITPGATPDTAAAIAATSHKRGGRHNPATSSPAPST